MVKKITAIVVVAITMIACNSQLGKSKMSEKDITIINAINGKVEELKEEGALIDYLLDNSYLSENVLEYLIASNRSDSFVELICIVNSPISEKTLDLIRERRRKINIDNMRAAQKITKGLSFTITKEKVIFSNEITLKSDNENCKGSCSSFIIYNKDKGYMIPWGNGSTESFFLFGCNPKKWICGTPKIEELLGSTGNTVTIKVTCENSESKCIRRVSKALPNSIVN